MTGLRRRASAGALFENVNNLCNKLNNFIYLADLPSSSKVANVHISKFNEMYDAYTVVPVAQKLPLEIQSITSHEETVLAGTKNGFLLVYKPSKDRGSRNFDVQMCRNFAKKSVNQLEVVSKIQIMVCLSDSTIFVHDIMQVNYPVMHTMSKTRGASMFSLHLRDDDELFMCVVMRRKLMFFRWKHREFEDIPPTDLMFPDTVRNVAWCGKFIGVAVRDEYFLLKVFDNGNREEPVGEVKTLFTTGGRSIEPLMVSLTEREVVGFCRDESVIFVNFKGQISREYQEIPWSEVPLALAYDSPYLVAVLSRNIEVRSIRPCICVQSIETHRPRFIARTINSQVFVAGMSEIWCLSAGPNMKQNIQQLVKDKQYDLAIQLAQKSQNEDAAQKKKKITSIKYLYAFHLYYQFRFAESFEIYRQIEPEVLYVIGLFPDLLPEKVRKDFSYPDRLLTDIPLDDLKSGLRELTTYLSEIRTKIAYSLAIQPRLRERMRKEEGAESSEGGLTEEEKEQTLTEDQLAQNQNLLRIVDTTLLKCYLETNDMLVASLLRLPDNSCNVTETEKALQKRKKFFELFLLYERKEMHSEALDLLKEQAKEPTSPLRGLDRSVHYLQNLGKTHMDLIFKYGSWVLREDPAEGLKIFTEDCEEVKGLDRDMVLKFLLQEGQAVVVDYLEHIIFQWDEDRPKFHDALSEQYVTKVKLLMTDYLQSLPEGHHVLPAGKEPGELGQYRYKLLYFLEYSMSYSPELLLVQIPHDALYEERALLLGRLKRHEQAIAIYTNILLDHKAAEKYCNIHYNRTKKEDSDVYLILLRMYAQPPDNSILGLMHSTVPKPRPNVSQALRVLKEYAGCIDTVKGAELLAGEIQLDQLWAAVEAVLQQTANRQRGVEINRGLLYATKLREQSVKMKAEGKKMTIGYDSGCVQCGKRISNSAFARFPDGTLVHYYCFKTSLLVNSGKKAEDRDFFVDRRGIT